MHSKLWQFINNIVFLCMSYSGKNATPNTVQIYDGYKWVEYDNFILADGYTQSNSLWNVDGYFGYSSNTNNRESLAIRNLVVPPKSFFSSVKFFVQFVGVGGGGDPKSITLPSNIFGINFNAGTNPPNQYIAEFLVALTHEGGSTLIAERFIASWSNVGGASIASLGGLTDVNIDVSVSSGSSSPPYIINLNYNAFPGDSIRYMVEIEWKVMGVTL